MKTFLRSFFLAIGIGCVTLWSSIFALSASQTIIARRNTILDTYHAEKWEADYTKLLNTLDRRLIRQINKTEEQYQWIRKKLHDNVTKRQDVLQQTNATTIEDSTTTIDQWESGITTNGRWVIYQYEKVMNSWLAMLNAERKTQGAWPLTSDSNLHRTAQERANTLAERYKDTPASMWYQWRLSFDSVHKRNKNDTYYNYPVIEKRFADRGIVAKNVNRVTFSEWMGAWSVTCMPEKDCTEALIKAIKNTRTMYMKEKPSQWVHYNQMTRPEFNLLWIGLAYSKNRYRIVFHYATELQ